MENKRLEDREQILRYQYGVLCRCVTTSSLVWYVTLSPSVGHASRYVRNAAFMCAYFSVIPVGLPILAVLDQSSVEGTYLGRVLLVWLFSMVTVLIVVAPKIFNTWRNPKMAVRHSRIIVSGMTTDTQTTNSRVSTPRSDDSFKLPDDMEARPSTEPTED
jgi:hypothetical protein